MKIVLLILSLISNLTNLCKALDYYYHPDSIGPNNHASVSKCTATDNLRFHGSLPVETSGEVLTGIVDLYNIYIGYSDNDYKIPYFSNNKASSTVGIVESFASGLSQTAYAKILATYNSATQFRFAGNAFVNIFPNITSMTDTDVDKYALKAFTQLNWPKNPKALYTVIFRGNIKYNSYRAGGSWNSDWCGYHLKFSSSTIQGLPASFIGDEAFAPTSLQPGCMVQYFSSNSVNYVSNVHPGAFSPPNRNPFGDAVVNIYAHETAEAVSDLDGGGWWRDCDGNENADICSWTFDVIHQSNDGTHYNVEFSTGKFLIQSNWAYKPKEVSG